MFRKRTLAIWTAIAAGAALLATARASSITYDVQFSDYVSGPTLQWLAKKAHAIGVRPGDDSTLAKGETDLKREAIRCVSQHVVAGPV